MAWERTLVLVKPDGVRRGLIGEIVGRLERKGLRLTGLKLMRVSPELADRHYAEHVAKPFFPELKRFITSGPVVAIVAEGESAVEVVRQLMGATRFAEALAGTIRGDWASSTTENLVHGSDSPASAEREVQLFFNPSELEPAP